MKNYNISLTEHELWALHCALIEAKFHDNPVDMDIASGSNVATVAREVTQLLLASPSYGDPQFEKWLKLTPDRREWRAALAHASLRPGWRNSDLEKKKLHIRILLSPFVVSDELVDRFILEAESSE